MKSIALFGQKGGCGKTTMSVHMAAVAQQAGEKVVLIDTDPQKTATGWSADRDNGHPVVATAATGDLEKVLQAGRQEGMTLAVVDTAPGITPDSIRIARAVDLLVIPCRPTEPDRKAAPGAIRVVQASKTNAVFVLSACPSFRDPEIAMTRRVLAAYGLPMYPGDITNRIAFSRAMTTGTAVTEFDPEGKAAEEVRSLWNWLKEQLQ